MMTKPNDLEPRTSSPVGRRKLSRRGSLLLSCCSIGTILVVWTVASASGALDSGMVPTIQSVGRALVDITTNGYKGSTLLGHLGASFYRLFTAFGLAILTAVPMGLLSGQNDKVRALFEPIIEFIRPLPPLAYYTILVLWMGIGNGSKIMLLYLACFAPIYVACVAAVTKIPASYTDVAATLGASDKQIFWKVILPYAAPDIFTGVRTAFGHGYSTLVAAEMVAAASGIGWMVLDASNWLRSDVIFAGIIVMGATGIIIDQFLRLAERKLVPWKGKL